MSEETDKIEQFKIDIKEDADVMSEQRDQANRDTRFVNVTGGQWEDFYHEEFSDRTKLELDLVSDYLYRFVGEWNQNRTGVEFKPDNGKTSEDDAEMINGIYRADFRQYSGKMALDNAVLEAATCGYGAYKLGTVFEDQSDPENEHQRVIWKPINNAYNSVFWDASASRIDKRDAEYCTELVPTTDKAFEKNWPDFNPSSAYTPDDLREFNYFHGGNKDILFIGKRYEIEKVKEKSFIYHDLINEEVLVYSKAQHDMIEDELREDENRVFSRERKVFKQYVNTTVFSGTDELETTRRIAGEWIPIVPIYGYWGFSDGLEWYKGLVRKLVDAQRLWNMQVSQLAENAASLGQEVPILDPEQVEGHEGEWEDRNNQAYLQLNALRDEEGNIVQTGPLGYLKPAQLDGSTGALMEIIPNYLNAMKGGAPQDTLDPNASGKAINALIKRENLNTQIINDHIAGAIERSGEIYLSIAEEIYNTPRIMRTIGIDGTESSIQLSKITLDKETGKQIEANTLNGKKFRSYADVGPQYESMREQTVDDLKGILEFISPNPQAQGYTPVILATMFDNMDGVGVGPLKEFNRKEMLKQGLVDPDGPEEEQFLAQFQQQSQEKDAQEQFLEKAAMKEEAEALNLKNSAIDKLAAALQKLAASEKLAAETDEIEEKTGRDSVESLVDIRQRILDSVQSLPPTTVQ